MRIDLFSDRHRLPMMLAAMAACLGMVACCWYAGTVPQITYGHDIFALLEGGWKWKWGILPHRDYYSHMGALVYFLIYLGIELGGGLMNAMPAAMCLFAVCILPLCIYVTFTRLPPFLAFLSTCILVAMALAPYQLRYGSGDLGYSCIYNRWGYSLFLTALFTVVLAPREGKEWQDVTDGVVFGSLLAVTIFLKISYGLLLATAPIGLAFVLRCRRYYYMAAVISALVVGALIQWMISLDLTGFLHDMSIAAHSREGLDTSGFAEALQYVWPDVCPLIVLWMLCCAAEILYADKLEPRRFWRIGVMAAAYALYSVAITMGNSPSGSVRETPAFSIGAIVLFSVLLESVRGRGASRSDSRLRFLRCWKRQLFGTALLLLAVMGGTMIHVAINESEHSRLLLGILILLLTPVCLMPQVEDELLKCPAGALIGLGFVVALGLMGPNVYRNIHGLWNAYDYKRRGLGMPSNEVFQSGSLAGLQILAYGGDPVLPTSYVGKVEEGLDLLNRTGNGGKAVEDMDFTNPFNVVRGVKPTIGSPVAWQLDMVYSGNSAPDPRQVFNGAQVVMAPKLFGDGHQKNLAVLSRLYARYLEEHYRLAGISAQWWLYVQK